MLLLQNMYHVLYLKIYQSKTSPKISSPPAQHKHKITQNSNLDSSKTVTTRKTKEFQFQNGRLKSIPYVERATT